MRVPQPLGTRGSLKWIQKAVNASPEVLNFALLSALPGAARINWLSPLANDGYAEYRDGQFLEKIAEPQLASALLEFWPARGPQWDALAKTDSGEVILVEAKAHIDEMFSAGCQASSASLIKIEAALGSLKTALDADPVVPWTGPLYQSVNRIAHLNFLKTHGIQARLVFVCFVGDDDMRGPSTADEWRGALHLVERMLGLPKRHPLRDSIVYAFPRVADLV